MKLSDLGVWSLEFVTPEKAAECLACKAPNRAVKPGRVNEYARSMIAGDWKLTHQGIAFDMHGKLIDGQHRLLGIVKARTGQWVMVFHWKTETDNSALDDGKPRTVCDAATIIGMDVKNSHCAVVNLILKVTGTIALGGHAGRVTRAEAICQLDTHRDAIAYADRQLGHQKGIGCALLKAVVAMAWYTQDRDRLGEMVEVIKTGVCPNETDIAAVKIREFVLNGKNIMGGSPARVSAFKKLQGATKAFLEHRPLYRMQESDGILFPIPEIHQS